MTITEFISNQIPERQELLTKIHEIIIEDDITVKAEIEPMMGKEMIIYKCNTFKYGLASVKNYMSLHVLPMYGSETLYSKYKALLPNANFQKGCINFKNEEEMPLKIVRQLIRDCSKIDLLKIREEYIKSKKEKRILNNNFSFKIHSLFTSYNIFTSLINCCKTFFASPKSIEVFG
jgi:hypothetical protein